MKKKQERTVVGIESDLKAAALRKAAEERRTMSAIVNIALEQYLGGAPTTK